MEERILEILTLTRNNALTKEKIYKKLDILMFPIKILKKDLKIWKIKN